MRLSLADFLLLLIPFAFFLLWLPEARKTKAITYEKFTVEEFEECRANHQPAIVFCCPEMFWGMRAPYGMNDEHFRRNFNAGHFRAFRHDYVFWGDRSKWQAETKWTFKRGG